MEWEVKAPIIYKDDNKNDDDDINDSDSNGISEIDDYEDDNKNDDDDINDSDGNGIREIDVYSDDNETYEDNNKDTISKSDDYSNDDDSLGFRFIRESHRSYVTHWRPRSAKTNPQH